MRFIVSGSFFYIKSLTVLLFFAFFLTSCLKIPDYPMVPQDADPSQMAQVKLITLNQDGFNEQFVGNSYGMIFFFSYPRDSAGISFGREYMVKVDKSWETSNGKYVEKRYKFNDKAVFSVPAGTYEVCAHKIVWGGRDFPLKKCYENSNFTFEPGQKYEIYIYYRAESKAVYRGTRYIWYMKIDDIKRVEEFKPNKMFVN